MHDNSDALKLTFPNNELDSAVVEIQWCLSPKALGFLAENGARHPFLLVVTCDNGGGKEERHLFPLLDGRAYLPLRHEGQTHVFATIVWGQTKSSAKEKFLERQNNRRHWDVSLVSFDSDDYLTLIGRSDRYGLEHYEVNVPANVFAKKPWDYEWTNRWFNTPPNDQCDFRRRRLLSFTVQPVLMLIIYLIGIGLYQSTWWTCKLLGLRNVQPFQLGHRSLSDEVLAPWYDCHGLGNSVFVDPFKSGKKFWPGLALSPLVWGPLAWFINWIIPHQGGDLLWLAPQAITYALFGMVIGWLAYEFIWRAGYGFFVWLNEDVPSMPTPKGTAWYEQKKIVTTLVCQEPAKDCEASPRPRRHTIALIYQDVKATVCRPFSA